MPHKLNKYQLKTYKRIRFKYGGLIGSGKKIAIGIEFPTKKRWKVCIDKYGNVLTASKSWLKIINKRRIRY